MNEICRNGNSGGNLSPKGGWAFILLVLVGCAVFYTVLNTEGSFVFKDAKGYPNYNDLAEALLAKRLYIRQEVDLDRTHSSEPNHPASPHPFIPDALLFQGKYYAVFQPFPSLLHVAWMAFAGVQLPTGAVVVSAATMNLVLMFLLLEFVQRSWLRDTPSWVPLYTWVSFGLSGVQTYLVSQPVVYNESIAVGFTCVLGGVLFFVHWLVSSKHRALKALASGVWFGAALASKVTLVAYPVGFLICFVVVGIGRSRSIRETSVEIVSFCTPVAIFVLLLLIYNWLRFGDFLDFGRSYLVLRRAAMYQYLCVDGNSFRLAHILPNLFIYVASTPDLLWRYSLPWLRFPTKFYADGNICMFRQNMVSLFVMTPVMILSLPRPGLFKFVATSRDLLTLVLSCVVSSLMGFCIFLFFFGSVPRYLYEFTPLMFVVLNCSLAAAWTRIRGSKRRELAWCGLLLVLLGAGVLMAIYAGLNGMVWKAPD